MADVELAHGGWAELREAHERLIKPAENKDANTMIAFKPGDPVTCVDDTFLTQSSELSLGAVYFVEEVESDWYRFIKITNNFGRSRRYLNSRFVPKQSTLQEVVDTIQEFAMALVKPPVPAVGQIWEYSPDLATKHPHNGICRILAIQDKYAWVQRIVDVNAPWTIPISGLLEYYIYKGKENVG